MDGESKQPLTQYISPWRCTQILEGQVIESIIGEWVPDTLGGELLIEEIVLKSGLAIQLSGRGDFVVLDRIRSHIGLDKDVVEMIPKDSIQKERK